MKKSRQSVLLKVFLEKYSKYFSIFIAQKLRHAKVALILRLIADKFPKLVLSKKWNTIKESQIYRKMSKQSINFI